MQRTLTIFGREPVAGRTKSRLARAVGARTAAGVSRALLEHTVAVARAAPGWRVVLSFAESPRTEWSRNLGVAVESQCEGDLGDRMRHAFERRALEGAEAAVIIGSDCPELRVVHLESAAAALQRRPVVLGPARDGGYWLIGQRLPGADLFEGVPWSDRTTATATRRVIRRRGLAWAELDLLQDVDTVEDLVEVIGRGRTGEDLLHTLTAAVPEGLVLPTVRRPLETWRTLLPSRWQVLAELGSGGQATVWLAADLELGEHVALKVLRPSVRLEDDLRWLREVRLGARLEHPRLVRLLEVLDLGPQRILVLEYAPGGTLSRRIALEGQQPLLHVVKWADQALEALSLLHEQRLVHGDVSPANLLLDAADDLKLTDLGLVRHLEQPQLPGTDSGAVGTPRYMAPEQSRGVAAQPASDLYSLGVALVQALTGSRPEPGPAGRAGDDLRTQRHDCPEWLAAFLGRLTDPVVGNRWPDASAARTALRRLVRIGASAR